CRRDLDGGLPPDLPARTRMEGLSAQSGGRCHGAGRAGEPAQRLEGAGSQQGRGMSIRLPRRLRQIAFWAYSLSLNLDFLKPWKMVFDNTDQLAGMVRPGYLRANFPWQLGLERFCLENAQGLRCRDLGPAYARRHLGYRFRGKTLYFPDYAWGRFNGATARPL